MDGRNRNGRGRAPRGVILTVAAAALLCLTALGIWLVLSEREDPRGAFSAVRSETAAAGADSAGAKAESGGAAGAGAAGDGAADTGAVGGGMSGTGAAGGGPSGAGAAGDGAADTGAAGGGMSGAGAVGGGPSGAGPESTSAAITLTTVADPSAESAGAPAEDAGTTGAGGADGPMSGPDGEGSGDITLLFAGDVYFSDHVQNAYDRAGGIGGVLDEKIRAEIDEADIFMVNQEFPFTDRGTAAEDKQFTFRVPPAKVSLLAEMGVDIVTMANNHILDFGPDGITDSLAALDGAGIRHVGAGEDLEQAKALEVLEVKGRKIGFLGVSRVYMAASWAAGAGHPGVFSTYDPTLALQEIRAAKEKCDHLVVYVHWGIERNTAPEEYQREMGRQYIDAGADLVVGSHPHVLQEIEYYKGKPIAYSLGNFVFGSSIPETELLKVVLSGDGEDESEAAAGGIRMEVTTIPCTSSGGYTRLR